MSYTLNFKNQAVDPSGAKAPITVPVGTVDSTHTSLALTGKGAANFGKLQQENFLRLLECFADTAAPTAPTIGQLWYDASVKILKVCVSTTPILWDELGGITVTTAGLPPTAPTLGDLWYEQTGTSSGVLYVFTGLGRYPTTPTTIGGWEQLFPTVQVFAGRDEYDAVRKDLEALIGCSVGSFGSGAIGHSIQNLTDFGALDQDLRTRYITLGSDANLLLSPGGDLEISEQAPSSTLFYGLDSNTPSDGSVFGAVAGIPTLGTAGSILVNGVTTVIPATAVSHSLQVDNGLLVWNGSTVVVVRIRDGSFEVDNGSLAWLPYVPAAGQYAIGTISTAQNDANVYPIDRQAVLWAHAVPLVGSKITHLKVEPTAQDWDVLLAAVRYGLNRLELPTGYYRQVPDSPFVYDGRLPPTSLTSLSVSDVRYPSAARRAGRRVGVVTQVQGFSQLLNAIQTGIVNRFALRGINGATGTNTTFSPTVSETLHASTTNVVASGSSAPTIRIRFSGINGRNGFLGSGGAIGIELSHALGSSLVGDVNLQSLLNARGFIRLTADRTRVFGLSLPRTLAVQPDSVGLWNATAAPFVLTTQTLGAASYVVSASRGGVGTTEDSFDITISFSAGSALSGVTTLRYYVLADAETYNPGSVPAYSKPLTFSGADLIVPL